MTVKPMIYYSHPIWGDTSRDARPDYAHERLNCELAVRNVKWLRNMFPVVEWYCPGEVELPIQTARKMNILTGEQVLKIDFEIIRNHCSGGLCHWWENSEGGKLEDQLFHEINRPHTHFSLPKQIELCNFNLLQSFVNEAVHYFDTGEKF